MRAQRKRKGYSIRLLSAYLGLQAGLLIAWPECALALALSAVAACGLGYFGFRRLAHPAPRPALPRIDAGLLQLLGHTPEELVGKTVIGVTPVGVAFVRADGVLAEVNQRFADIIGYSRAELIGRTISEISLPEEWPENQALMAEAVAGQRDQYQIEKRYRRKDGGVVWAELSATILRDQNGEFLYAISVVVDISERKRTEQSLRESEQRFRALVASLREGIMVREPDATISSCNPGIERIFGLPRERIVGRTALSPDVQYINTDGTPFDPAQQPGHIAFTSGQPADDVEFGIVRPDGTSRWVIASARPLFRDGERAPHAAVVSINDITERRAAERELERQRSFLRTVLDSVPNLIAVRDREQRFAMVNRTLADFYGTTPRQMIGKRHSDFVADPARAESIRQSDLQLLSSGGVSGPSETEVADASGVQRSLHVQKRVIAGDRGEPSLVLVVGTDITERRRLQEALQRSVEVRDTILENSIAGIVFLDKDGRAVWTNRAAEQMFGIDRGAIAGKSIERYYLSRSDYLETGAAVAQAVLAGRAYRTELRMRRSDGTVFWVQLSGKTVVPGDLSQGTVWVVLDISERKLAEFELERQRHFLRQIIDSIPNFVFVRDRDSRFTMCNRALADFCGLAPESIVGRTSAEIGRGLEEVDSSRRMDALAFERGGRLDPYESCHVDAQGTVHWHENNKTVLYDADGVARQVLGVGTPITHRKQAEAQLQRMNEELERRVAERTAQLEASVKELEAFSYSVSHDLRAPLRAIDGYSQILIEEARGSLAPDARMCLDKISRNARRMAELIDRLLAFARYSRAPLERRSIDLGALVQSVIDEQPREARDIEFSVAPLKPCLADAQLLRQVFGNLVSNAVKYTRPRELAKIEIGSLERDGTTAYYVRDNGVGFDMRYAHKLFGVFQRLHSEREFEGTGAGLAIVQRIVSRHGGRVWAEGEVGKGATFYFVLGSEPIAATA